MTIWSHSDAKCAWIAGVGMFILLISIILAVSKWVQSKPVPTAAWILGCVGMVMFTVALVPIWRSQRRVAAYQQRRNERARAIRDKVKVGKNPARPYFVYLRPFEIDGKFVEAPRDGADREFVEKYGWPTASHDLQSALALLVYPYSDLVALSDDPGEAGPGYVRSTALLWKQDVEALCEHAEGVFVVPFARCGTAWEVEMLIRRGWLDKCLFVMPAKPPIRWFTRNYRALWEAGRARYPELDLPEYDARGAIVQAGTDGRVFHGFGRAPLFTDLAYWEQVKRDRDTLRSWVAELSARNGPPDESPGRGL